VRQGQAANYWAASLTLELNMEPSIKISLFALLVSFCSFYISWKAYHRDNSDLRVSLEYWPQPEDYSCFNVRITNHGRRVALVERIIVNFKKGAPLQDSIAGGRAVTEAEPFDYQLYIYTPDGVPHHIPPEVTSAEIFDTLGRRYRFPGFSNWIKFRKFRTEIGRLWEEEQASKTIDKLT
jgi:hypothetical protein